MNQDLYFKVRVTGDGVDYRMNLPFKIMEIMSRSDNVTIDIAGNDLTKSIDYKEAVKRAAAGETGEIYNAENADGEQVRILFEEA